MRWVFITVQRENTLKLASESSHFTEPDYARTMIDVQRDWHYLAYLQAN